MSFNKKGYVIVKKAISKDLSNFLYNYLLLKRHVATTFINTRYLYPGSREWGTWEDPQVPGTYSCYGDVAMETLLTKLKSLMEKTVNSKLVINYSYTRLYKNGDILKRHKDRYSCEISTTLNLGGDPWPIYLNPDSKEGSFNESGYEPSNSKGLEVNLDCGDMLVYAGHRLEHWREPFKGTSCGQVFLHYTTENKDSLNNKFDGRPHLGLPPFFKLKI